MAYGAEKSDRLENGLTAIANARLEKLATKGKWRKIKRWDTDSTVSELIEASQVRELTLKEKAIVALHADLGHEDPRVRRIATSNAIAMEGQNQTDDLLELKKSPEQKKPAIHNDTPDLDETIAMALEELAGVAKREEEGIAPPHPPEE